MTDTQRQAAHAAYHAFASDIQEKRNRQGSPVFFIDSPEDGERVRLAEEFIDIVYPSGNNSSAQCYNWITRQRFELSPSLLQVIEDLRDRISFSQRDFIRWFPSPVVGEAIFHKLVKHHLLVIDLSNDQRALTHLQCSQC